MDYRAFCSRHNVGYFENSMEIWYSRLNNLKEKYGIPYEGIENPKAEKVILSLIDRLTLFTPLFVRIQTLRSQPRYPSGTNHTPFSPSTPEQNPGV